MTVNWAKFGSQSRSKYPLHILHAHYHFLRCEDRFSKTSPSAKWRTEQNQKNNENTDSAMPPIIKKKQKALTNKHDISLA